MPCVLWRKTLADSEEEKSDCLCLKWAFHSVTELYHYCYLVFGLEAGVMVDREKEKRQQRKLKSRGNGIERNYMIKW